MRHTPAPRHVALRDGISRRFVGLESHELVVAAMKATGSDDFGGNEWSEPLDVLCTALRRDADLHAAGRALMRGLIVDALGTRVRLNRLVQDDPSLAESAVDPIVITGLPASGAGILHRRLAALGLRTLRVGEAWFPGTQATTSIGRRCGRRHARGLGEVDGIAADDWLAVASLRSLVFEALCRVPGYAEWFDSAELATTFVEVRCALGAIGAGAGGVARRWALRGVGHLDHIDELLTAFPQATVVRVIRDEATTIDAVASLVCSARRLTTANVDPEQIARHWRWRVRHMTDRSLERTPPGTDRVIDVTADELRLDGGTAVAAQLRIDDLGDRGR